MNPRKLRREVNRRIMNVMPQTVFGNDLSERHQARLKLERLGTVRDALDRGLL